MPTRPTRNAPGRADRHPPTIRQRLFVEIATRPQTIGYALLDSPVAFAAWMATADATPTTRSRAPSSNSSFLGDLTCDRILSDVTLYWLARRQRLSGTIVSRSLRRRPCREPQPLPPTAVPVRLHDVTRRVGGTRAARSRRAPRTSSTSTGSTRVRLFGRRGKNK